MICEIGLERPWLCIQRRGHTRDELSADSVDGWPLFAKLLSLGEKPSSEFHRDFAADEE